MKCCQAAAYTKSSELCSPRPTWQVLLREHSKPRKAKLHPHHWQSQALVFSGPEDPLEKEMWLCRQVYAEEGCLIVSPSGCCAPKEVPAQCSLWALAWMLPGTACVEAGRVVKQTQRGGQLSAMAAL